MMVDRIKVQATTSEYEQITVSKDITIIKSTEPVAGVTENKNILENNGIFILIPGAVIGSSILLRKKGLLDPLSERFSVVESLFNRFDELFERLEFTERFESIKEKIPVLKNR